MKKIEIELPEKPSAGHYSCCPSGDNEYDDALKKWNVAVNQKILEAIPDGYHLKSCTVKEVKIVKNIADVTLEKF